MTTQEPSAYLYQHVDTGKSVLRFPHERITDRNWNELDLVLRQEQAQGEAVAVASPERPNYITDWNSWITSVNQDEYIEALLDSLPRAADRETERYMVRNFMGGWPMWINSRPMRGAEPVGMPDDYDAALYTRPQAAAAVAQGLTDELNDLASDMAYEANCEGDQEKASRALLIERGARALASAVQPAAQDEVLPINMRAVNAVIAKHFSDDPANAVRAHAAFQELIAQTTPQRVASTHIQKWSAQPMKLIAEDGLPISRYSRNSHGMVEDSDGIWVRYYEVEECLERAAAKLAAQPVVLTDEQIMDAFPKDMGAVRLPPGWRAFAKNIERTILARFAQPVALKVVLDEIGTCIADPMWANHAEISKASLKRWHTAIKQVARAQAAPSASAPNPKRIAVAVLEHCYGIDGVDARMVQLTTEVVRAALADSKGE